VSYALLIDDYTASLASLSRLAELRGLTVLTASSWDEGLKLAHVYSPVLVVADYDLPGSRHGLKLLAEIRRLNAGVRLILLSAYIDEADVQSIEQLGLIDKAVPKSRPGASDEIVDEIQDAQDRFERPTDWAAYGKAYRDARAVPTAALDDLDDHLKKKRGIS